ncbi:MAG: LolA-like protein [Solirubrobacteraceae bacterium]
MARRKIPIAVCVTAVSAALAGCGGSSGNGIEAKSASAIVSAALRAAETAKTVHVSGSGKAEGSSVRVDLKIDGAAGAVGTITKGSLSVRLIRVGSRAYINGGAAFYERYGGSEAAKLFKGRWLEASATKGEAAALSDLTSLKSLLSGIRPEAGSLKKGATQRVDGVETIAVTDAAKHGTLYVATSGKPYPVAIEKEGAEGGRFNFSEWEKPVSVTAPTNTINLEKLEKQAG